MYPAIHISPSKFCSFFKNWIIHSYFKIAVYYSILARLSSWWFSWLCASHAIYNIRIYNTRTRTQPSSVCPHFRRSSLMVIFKEMSWNQSFFVCFFSSVPWTRLTQTCIANYTRETSLFRNSSWKRRRWADAAFWPFVPNIKSRLNVVLRD